jgi:hypothetical protein
MNLELLYKVRYLCSWHCEGLHVDDVTKHLGKPDVEVFVVKSFLLQVVQDEQDNLAGLLKVKVRHLHAQVVVCVGFLNRHFQFVFESHFGIPDAIYPDLLDHLRDFLHI